MHTWIFLSTDGVRMTHFGVTGEAYLGDRDTVEALYIEAENDAKISIRFRQIAEFLFSAFDPNAFLGLPFEIDAADCIVDFGMELPSDYREENIYTPSMIC